MLRVTVAIPSYNHEKYIAQAIQSVLDQTYQDFEIVITDDGSIDHTVDVIKGFHDSRIRLFCFEKNYGASTAMNNCIREGRGEYIAILNSDDIFLPDKLEKQVKFLDDCGEVGAVFGFPQIIDDDGNEFLGTNNIQQKNRSRFEWLNYFFYHGNCLYHPSALVREECYKKVGYYDERLAQTPDFDFWIRLCMKYDIHILQENFIKYRIRSCSANASADKPETRKRTSFEQTCILRNYLTIPTEQGFFSIFPEALEYSKGFEAILIPFYISLLAIKKNTPPYLLFAFQNLFRLFEDREIEKKIYEKYHFSMADLIKFVGKYDVFNVELERIKNNEIQNIIAEKEDAIRCVIAEKEDAIRCVIAEKEDAIRCVIAEKEDAIVGLTHSTSWKITSPIRFLKDFLKYIYYFLDVVHTRGMRYGATELSRWFYKSFIYRECENSMSGGERGLVSIVLPVYNQSNFLNESIRSVLEQSYKNIELIIVNDGSTDNVERILNMYVHDPRIIILSQKNKKLPAALNIGFDMASGEYYTWTSADNIMRKDQIKTMVGILKNNSSYGMVYSDYSLIDARKNPFLNSFFRKKDQDKKNTDIIRLPNIHEKRESFFMGDNFVGPSFLYRRDSAWCVGKYTNDTFGGEDYDYWMRIFGLFNIYHCKKVLYTYRIHDNTLLARTEELHLKDNISRAIYRNSIRRQFVNKRIFNFIQYKCDHAFASPQKGGESVFIFKLSDIDHDFITKTLNTYKNDFIVCILDIPLRDMMELHIYGMDMYVTTDSDVFFYFKEKLKYKIFFFSIERNIELFKNLVKYRLFEKRNVEKMEEDKDFIFYYPNKIRVAIHVDSLDKGGLEQVVYNLASNINRNKIEYVIFVHDQSYGNTGKLLLEKDFKILLVEDDQQLEYLILKHNIDVAHFQNSEFGMDICHDLKIPILYTVHNSFPSDKYNFIKHIVDRFIAVSFRVEHMLIAKNNISPSSISVITNGFNKDIFNDYKHIKRKDIGFSDGDFIFVYIGAFYVDKFHTLLITAFRDLSKNYKNFKLILIGDVLNEEYYLFLLKMIEEFGLVQKVQVFISISKADLGGLLAISDCFVFPSLHEGWSNAVMEAMYFGLPLILSDTGSSRDVIVNNDIGIIIPNPYDRLVNLTESMVIDISKQETWNNLPDLKNAMREIHLNYEVWKRRAIEGRERVLDFFSVEDMVKKYEKTYFETYHRSKQSRESF